MTRLQTSTKTPAAIALVGPDGSLEQLLLAALQPTYRVSIVRGRRSFVRALAKKPYVAIVDGRRPDLSDFVGCMAHCREVPMLLLTGGRSRARPVESAAKGLFDVLRVPCQESELRKHVDQLVTLWTMRATIRELQDQLEEARTAGTRLLANISHEFRTPLNAIIGFCELLREPLYGPVSDETRTTFVEHIYTAGGHLLALVNNLLDVARLHAGGVELQCQECDIFEVVHWTADSLVPLAHRRQILLDLPEGDLGSVWADEMRLRQILFNLISNAIKFTPPGGVVSVDAVADETHVSLSVRDTGIGISPVNQASIFEPFTRLAQSCTPEQGTGLGLAITHELVLAHGGTIKLDSTPGVGSCFTVTLPRFANSKNVTDLSNAVPMQPDGKP